MALVENATTQEAAMIRDLVDDVIAQGLHDPEEIKATVFEQISPLDYERVIDYLLSLLIVNRLNTSPSGYRSAIEHIVNFQKDAPQAGRSRFQNAAETVAKLVSNLRNSDVAVPLLEGGREHKPFNLCTREELERAIEARKQHAMATLAWADQTQRIVDLMKLRGAVTPADLDDDEIVTVMK